MWWNFVPFRSILPGTSVSLCLCALHTPCPLVTEQPCCYQIHHRGVEVLVFQSLLFTFPTAPEHKGSDAGNLDAPKRGRELLLLSKKVSTKQLDMWRDTNHIRITSVTVLSLQWFCCYSLTAPNFYIKLYHGHVRTGKTIVCVEFGTIWGFRHPPGQRAGLSMYPPMDKGGGTTVA